MNNIILESLEAVHTHLSYQQEDYTRRKQVCQYACQQCNGGIRLLDNNVLKKSTFKYSTKNFNSKCERTNKIIYVDKERIDYVTINKEDRYDQIVCSFCAFFQKKIFNQIEEKDKYAWLIKYNKKAKEYWISTTNSI